MALTITGLMVVTDPIRFTDGAAYERYMGVWSQRAGDSFLEWLAPAPGLRWLDVGCGNGAFTELIAGRCAPASLSGIDPSVNQLAYARARPALRRVEFGAGDAMALPFADDTFDVAVMPLVIFFVPDPEKGVAEMARVVTGGGLVTAYAWDMVSGGFPYESLRAEMRGLGVPIPQAPSNDASRLEALQDLWFRAGLDAIEARPLEVHRTFTDFDEYWTAILGAPSTGPKLAAMTPEALARLQSSMRTWLQADASGRITCVARANAVTGRVPH